MNGSVIVLLGGAAFDPSVRPQLSGNCPVIAADSGVDQAIALGLPITLAVGDMDSISLAGLAHLQNERIPTERHPADKDASDGELGLDVALRWDPAEINILSGGGEDRLDHLLITAALLTRPSLAGRRVRAWIGITLIVPLQAGERLVEQDGQPQTVSLLAVNGPAHGVRTEGLEFALDGETLWPWSSRGLSNRSTTEPWSVALDEGSLLVIRPNVADTRSRQTIPEP